MKYEFECRREMMGDRAYATGDTRLMTAGDAVELVRRKALVPIGEEAIKAMADIMAQSPDNTGGIVMSSAIERVKEDDYSNKAMGNAPANKAGGKGKGGRPKRDPATGATATAPGATPSTAAPAVPNVGEQSGAPQAPSPAPTPGAPGGDTAPAEPAAPAGETPPAPPAPPEGSEAAKPSAPAPGTPAAKPGARRR